MIPLHVSYVYFVRDDHIYGQVGSLPNLAENSNRKNFE